MPPANCVTKSPGLCIVRPMMGRTSPPIFFRALLGSCLILTAGPSPMRADEKPAPKGQQNLGAWLKLPADGTPWEHAGTGLRFPQMLGQFSLASVFRDTRPEAGVAVTYVRQGSDLKASVVIFPCPHPVELGTDIDAVARREHERLVSDLKAAAQSGGYAEKQRSPLSEQALTLWQNGSVPMTVQTIEMTPVENRQKPQQAPPPDINHWLSVLIYRDHFVQLSVIIPTPEMNKDRKQVDDLITQLLQCIRDPALKTELLLMCQQYLHNPLSKEGRESADALLAYSKASPVFEVILPGEALTPVLNEISAFSPDAALDLLRAFIVGSSVVSLQGGSVDESLDEGARMFNDVATHYRKTDSRFALPFIDDLAKAREAKRTASFLKEHMQSAKKP